MIKTIMNRDNIKQIFPTDNADINREILLNFTDILLNFTDIGVVCVTFIRLVDMLLNYIRIISFGNYAYNDYMSVGLPIVY